MYHICSSQHELRTYGVDDLIFAGQESQDHLFMLDQGSSPSIFLILSETEYTGVFALVASCEEVLFTQISLINEVAGGIRLRDIRKTWDLPLVEQPKRQLRILNKVS
jgi:hypothetical protein